MMLTRSGKATAIFGALCIAGVLAVYGYGCVRQGATATPRAATPEPPGLVLDVPTRINPKPEPPEPAYIDARGVKIPVLPGAKTRVTINDAGRTSDVSTDQTAKGGSLSTSSPDVAGKAGLSAANPTGFTGTSGGAFDLKISGGLGGNALIILGAIVMLGAVPLYVYGRGFGFGLANCGAVAAGGILLIGIGLMPDLAAFLILGGGGVAAVYVGLQALQLRRASKSVSDLTRAAGAIVRAVDEADTGDGSAGATIKAAVSANVGKGNDLEAIIDRIIADAGA